MELATTIVRDCFGLFLIFVRINYRIYPFKKNLEVILNASETGYSNGPVEGMNRMIKQIQRTAFGFRNYHHMISRIKLRQMKTKPDKKTELKVA
nr:transposase [Lactiplantibacillus plantarum]